MTDAHKNNDTRWWVKFGAINLACLFFIAALIGLSWFTNPRCDRDNEGALKAGGSWNPVLRCVCTQVRPYECGWVGVDR